MTKTTVVLIRHAKPASAADLPDPDLAGLSDEGRATQERMSEQIQDQGLLPDLILTSPILRASETAEIIGQMTGAQVVVEPALGSAFDADALLEKIEDEKTTFLVGHAPTLADFTHYLAGKPVLHEGIAQSGAVVIAFESTPKPGKGTFEGYIKP